MAIADLQKILIVGHKSQQSALLDRLQSEGFVHICTAEQSVMQEQFSEPQTTGAGQNQAELLRSRLSECISFLQPHVQRPASLRERLTPRSGLALEQVEKTIQQSNADELLRVGQDLRKKLTQIDAQIDQLQKRLCTIQPWTKLDAAVENLGQSKHAVVMAGIIPDKHSWEEVVEQLKDTGIAIELINQEVWYHCLVAYAQVSATEARQALHEVDFEPANFEGLTGRPAEIIENTKNELAQLNQQRNETLAQVAELAQKVQTFGILHDHFQNLAHRDQIIGQALATKSSFFMEGWIHKTDWEKLKALVGEFNACMVEKTTPAEGEEAPVDLQNVGPVKPFEVITSLYGMPGKKDVDPTPFLAPFFAVFFGLCLTDAGYGLSLLILSLIGIRILGRGSAKLFGVLAMGGGMAVILGAITGGIFGDAPDKLGWLWLIHMRDYLLQFGFDPFKSPMIFFVLAVILGYIQIIFGQLIGFINKFKQKDIIAALCDHLTWLILLNSIVFIALAKTGMLPTWPVPICLVLLSIAAVGIVLGSQREGSRGERLGMGLFNLFSAIFYLGDVLSYLRLMGLGLVTAGIAIAVNLIASLAWQIPILGVLLAIVILIIGHIGNLLLSSLSAFVHTLRLQYVEFFPKFFAGGGAEFRPFAREWKYTKVEP
ncbi:MAG: hypothetical protein GWP14_03445 [Actinobacteria bacterium]|nr:hypothetical protein [Actinomycetota bacterium]